MSKTITAQELVDEGYLQEVNRLFFHPLGLAMYVDTNTNQMGVLDFREDPEGVVFNDPSLDKATKIKNLGASRKETREKVAGFWVQPVTTKTNVLEDGTLQVIEEK